jgi:apolipoprotein N-acyltransferase
MDGTTGTDAAEAGSQRLRGFLSRRLLRRPEISLWELLLALGSGLLLSLAYVGPMVPEMVFLAPAVFLYTISRERTTPGAAALLSAAFGLAFSGPGIAWVGGVTWAGWAGVVVLIAVPFAAFAAAVSYVRRRLGVPLAAVAPVAWVAAELFRGWVFTGFPWLFLGHALSDRLVLIQIADLGGVYVVSFLAALVASAAVDLGRQWASDSGQDRSRLAGLRHWGAGWASAAAAGAVLIFTIAYGAWRLAGTETGDGPRLVLVQGNIYTPDAETDEEHDGVGDEILRVHGELSRRSAAEGDLLVWSESMIFCYYNDPDDEEAKAWREELTALLGEIGLPLLAGASATDKGVPGGYGDDRRLDYNSAFLLTQEAEIAGRYDKVHLVPFGEYVPLASLPVFAGLTPYAADDPGYTHGSPDQPLLEWKDPGTGRTWRFGVLICYEDAFGGPAREAAGGGRGGADFLVNLSSDVWFAGSAEILQHFRISRFRAVETRLALVRCCNVGVTCFIDPTGRVTRMLEGSDRPEGAQGAVSAPVPVRRHGGTTVYVRVGDLFALTATLSLVAFLAASVRAGTRANENRTKCS